MQQEKRNTPQQVFEEYRIGMRYKATMGERGMYRQNELNRRFYQGDQWHGAACGSERPLVRHNMIRRIGEYKMAVVGVQPPAPADRAASQSLSAPASDAAVNALNAAPRFLISPAVTRRSERSEPFASVQHAQAMALSGSGGGIAAMIALYCTASFFAATFAMIGKTALRTREYNSRLKTDAGR